MHVDWESLFANFIAAQLPEGDPAHDLAHVHRVVANARMLAAAEGADLSVVLPAAWLHDCVAVPKDSPDRARASRLAAAEAVRLLHAAGIPRDGVGKVDDLFAGRGITSQHTASNAEGIARLREWLSESSGGLLFANLVDFDQLYGHRNDVPGFYGALREFDAALPTLLDLLREELGGIRNITVDVPKPDAGKRHRFDAPGTPEWPQYEVGSKVATPGQVKTAAFTCFGFFISRLLRF